MLINFTNHPYSVWSENQRMAADCFGEIVDVPFPEVDPNADETTISHLADEYVDQLLAGRKVETLSVHIMGEFTLCYAIISRLQARGVRCMASCTRRDVIYSHDGTKKVGFHFTRFREYTL